MRLLFEFCLFVSMFVLVRSFYDQKSAVIDVEKLKTIGSSYNTHVEEQRVIRQKACSIFAGVLAKVMAMTANPILAIGATAVTHFTAVIVRMTSYKRKDVWAEIEDRLETKIDDRLTHHHFAVLRSEFAMLQQFMKIGDKLTVDDLNVHIMTKRSLFLPQTFEYTAFNSKWLTALPAYLTYVTAAYLELIGRGKVDKCTLAKEMNVIRKETVTAAKALFRARYRTFDGYQSYTADTPGCRGMFCGNSYWFSYRDGATQKTVSRPISKVRSEVLDPLESDTHKLIWEQLVEKVNKFFTMEICGTNCTIPKPIAKDEVFFWYTLDCYGVDEDGEQCQLPCASYGEGYHWCPTTMKHNNLLWDWDWDYCSPVRFSHCMPVQGTLYYGQEWASKVLAEGTVASNLTTVKKPEGDLRVVIGH